MLHKENAGYLKDVRDQAHSTLALPPLQVEELSHQEPKP